MAPLPRDDGTTGAALLRRFAAEGRGAKRAGEISSKNQGVGTAEGRRDFHHLWVAFSDARKVLRWGPASFVAVGRERREVSLRVSDIFALRCKLMVSGLASSVRVSPTRRGKLMPLGCSRDAIMFFLWVGSVGRLV